MSKIGTRQTRYIGLSLVESRRIYDPQSIARRIVNLDLQPDGTLKSIEDSAIFDPKSGTVLPGPIMGLAHLETLDGANQVTVLRSNTQLFRHQGWTRTYQSLLTGLTYDPHQPFPDVCLPIGGRIVWCNGIDRPRVIDCSRQYGRLVTPLGFASAPAAPTALSPTPGGYDAGSGGTGMSYGVGAGTGAANMAGYSVPGNVGSVSQFNGEDGALLDSTYLYRTQWESVHGDLSPLSPPSNLAAIQAQSTGYWTPQATDYVRKNKLDMLRRGLCVRGIDKGEEHTRAIRIYRTTDTSHTTGEYHLLTRIPGRQTFTYPDSKSDAILVNGDVPVECVESLPFRVACEYQGRLVAGNFPGNPGRVRWSQPGSIGTFERDDYCDPDAGGGQVTAAVAYNGGVYLFTESSIFRLDIDAEGTRLRPLPVKVGCVAPHTARVLPDGRLVFLSRSSLYALSPDHTVEDLGLEISDILYTIQTGRAGRAVADIDPDTGIYVLAIPTQGSFNNTVLGYDYRVQGWRQYDVGSSAPVTLHAAAGRAGHLLVGAYDVGVANRLRVWNRAAETAGGVQSTIFESNELRIDPQGLRPFRCRGILVGFIESDAAEDSPGLSVRVWTSSRKTGETPAVGYIDTTMELVGQDFPNDWALGELTLNGLTTNTGAYYRDPMVTWRIIPIDVSMITGLRFRLSATYSRRLHLHGCALIMEELGNEASRVPGPKRKPTS